MDTNQNYEKNKLKIIYKGIDYPPDSFPIFLIFRICLVR